MSVPAIDPFLFIMNEVSTIVDILTPLNDKLEVSQQSLNKNNPGNEELTRKNNNWFGFKKITNKKQSFNINACEIVKKSIDIYVFYLFLG